MTSMIIDENNMDSILKELRELQTFKTPIVQLHSLRHTDDNAIYVKKEDCIPFSFGGNKVRIAANYFIDLIAKGCDSVITYGSSSSNMCRVVSNFAYKYGIDCTIISPEEAYEETANSRLVKALGAEVITVPVDCVHQTIEDTIGRYKHDGRNPYFIYGGGHGKLGTDAYRVVMEQIHSYEIRNGINFNYIFITVGTGTSISGLIIENKYRNINKNIIGVSIARELTRANEVLAESIKAFSGDGDNNTDGTELNYELYDYRLGGYGKYTHDVENTVRNIYSSAGLNLDLTYTGKAFTGMKAFICDRKVTGQNILFIHTGGTPLFFDAVLKITPPLSIG